MRIKKIKAGIIVLGSLTSFSALGDYIKNISNIDSQAVPAINAALGVNINTTSLNNVLTDLTNTYPGGSGNFTTHFGNANTITEILNGHTVTVSTADGTALSALTDPKQLTNFKDLIHGQSLNFINSTTGSPDALLVKVDGKTIFNGSQLSAAQLIQLAQALSILPFIESATSTSLSSISPSSITSQLAYNTLNGNFLSFRQKQAIANQQRSSIFAMGDIKYEHAGFTNNGVNGDIVGATMALSTEVSGVELGARIPYDHLDFTNFTADRTGTMLYAKKNWDLPNDLVFTTMANFNYLATYVTKLDLTQTYGGGFGTSLTYDTNGVLVPRISFAYQYNQDDYGKANAMIVDDHQSLVKMGGSLGYRVLENAVLQFSANYNRDVTDYKTIYNQTKGNDYTEIMFGGNYMIANTWQVSLNYKKVLGLTNFYSDSVFLGSTFGF